MVKYMLLQFWSMVGQFEPPSPSCPPNTNIFTFSKLSCILTSFAHLQKVLSEFGHFKETGSCESARMVLWPQLKNNQVQQLESSLKSSPEVSSVVSSTHSTTHWHHMYPAHLAPLTHAQTSHLCYPIPHPFLLQHFST